MPFQLITYVIIMAIYRVLEITVMRRKKSRLAWTGSKDPTYYLVAVPFLLAILEPPLEYVIAGHQSAPTCFYGGLGLFIAATVFRVKGLADIKGGFSPYIEKKANHVLATGGVYGVIRHPLYLSMLLLAAAAATMLTARWAWLLILFNAAGVLARIRKEEEFLLEQFPEYRTYCEKTWRLVPGIY